MSIAQPIVRSVWFRGAVIAILVSLCSVSHSDAIDVYDFGSESDRVRYEELIFELRCPKCQNQNLADSNSSISVDLRGVVARMIRQGLSDKEIKEYMVNRYGDFVLYRPPVQKNTMVLWWGPVGFALIGLLVFVVILVRRQRAIAQLESPDQSTAGDQPSEETEKEGTE